MNSPTSFFDLMRALFKLISNAHKDILIQMEFESISYKQIQDIVDGSNDKENI